MKKNELCLNTINEIKTWLSTVQTGKTYRLNKASVLTACKAGRFSEDEAVETAIGWLISPSGAERLWGYRLNKK